MDSEGNDVWGPGEMFFFVEEGLYHVVEKDVMKPMGSRWNEDTEGAALAEGDVQGKATGRANFRLLRGVTVGGIPILEVGDVIAEVCAHFSGDAEFCGVGHTAEGETESYVTEVAGGIDSEAACGDVAITSDASVG